MFAPFPDDSDLAAEQVEVCEVHGDEFSDAYACGVEGFDDGAVANSRRGVGGRGFEQLFHLFDGEKFWKPPGQFGG